MKGRLFHTTTVLVLLLACAFQLSSGGTLMHPERRGQTSGRIDPGIAVLDGIGLLSFIIPGLVAYAIDFSTGAIYLPGTSSSASESKGEEGVVIVPASPGGPAQAELEEHAGRDIDLSFAGI